MTRLYSTFTGVQKAKVWVLRQRQGVSALVRVPVAHTGSRAGEVAEDLVVELRALAPAVTNLCHVQTDSRPTTAVETWTRGRFTQLLICMIWAVRDPVTSDVHRQAVTIT